MTKRVLISLRELENIRINSMGQSFICSQYEEKSLSEWFDSQPPAPQWVRVEDKPPPRGVEFFAILDDECGQRLDVCLLQLNSIFPSLDEHHITHWMPIPELPGEDSEKR